MHQNTKLVSLFALSLALSACGGSDSKSTPTASASAASVIAPSSMAASSAPASSIAPSSAAVSSTMVSSTTSSLVSSAAISSSAASASATVITIDMTTGWRGNSTGSATHSGVNLNAEGITFSASGDGVGAVFDLIKPTQLENAVVEMVVNVSSELKASGASLQIFAQVKNTWAGEWDCWTDNSAVTANSDVTATCTLSEADGRFNQAANDVQLGIQAKGTPTGTVTIKSAKITLAPSTGASSSSSSTTASAYSANVANLKSLASFPIGAAVTNNDYAAYNILTNTSEQALVERHFNQMTAGNIMKVKYMHPDLNSFSFASADAFVDYANTQSMTVHAHALIWHSSYQVPDFMKNWTGTSAAFLTMLDTHVTTIVNHFASKGNIHSWDVVNEALTDDTPSNFRTTDSTFYVKSGNSSIYIEKAFQAARAANATVDLYYNDYNIEQNNAKTNKMMAMLQDFKSRNIPISGVGFQMHVCLRYPSAATIAAAMKRVVDEGLKVKITELDVAVNQPYCDSYPTNKISSFTPAVALEQKQRYCEIVKAYLDTVPANLRGGITVWGVTDANTWIDDLYKGPNQFNGEKISWPLLFDNNYHDKPALRGFADGLLGTACNNP
jgi:endo-1,4-beta-xylanase